MDKNRCTIYIVRHGETEWNVAKRIQGHTDSPLTDVGIKQAKEVGELLRDVQFDAIFSSDSLRAKRTAEIMQLERKLAVVTTEILRERYFGTFEGKHVDTIKEFDEIFDSLDEAEKASYTFSPDMESDNDVTQRFLMFLREIAVRYAGKTLLVVTHGGVLRSFLIRIGFGTYDELPWGTIKNTAYIKLETDGIDFFVKDTHGIELTAK